MDHIPDGNHYGDEFALHARYKPSKAPQPMYPRIQPVFKLHGSVNWVTGDGEPLVVMGEGKERTIERYEVLKWIATKFREYVSQADTRLTIIGYSFGDKHINDTIVQGWETTGRKLRMMIVNPDGRDVVRMANPSYGGMIPGPKEPIEEIHSVESTAHLSVTFGGKDRVGHGELIRFLSPPAPR